MMMSNFSEEQRQYWIKEAHRGRRSPTNPTVEAYVVPKLEFIERTIPLRGRSIVEIGAGNGYFSYHLDALGPTTATDFSPVMLDINPVKNKLVMDARNLKLPDASFDVSFCHAVLHHIDRNERVRVISEMRRVARSHVVIIEPNRNNPLMAAFGLIKKEEHGVLDFSLSYLRRLVEEAGLDILQATSFGWITPNRMPLPFGLLSFMRKMEKPRRLGMTNIIIAVSRR